MKITTRITGMSIVTNEEGAPYWQLLLAPIYVKSDDMNTAIMSCVIRFDEIAVELDGGEELVETRK